MRVKISELSPSNPLDGTEIVVMDQSNVTVTSALSNIKAYTLDGFTSGSDVSALSANWENTYTTYSAASSNYAVKNANNNFTTDQSFLSGMSASSITLSAGNNMLRIITSRHRMRQGCTPAWVHRPRM